MELPDLKLRLSENAEALALDLFGKPTSRNREALRFGSRGSKVVFINGPRRGKFKDFESGAGGSMLDAIHAEYGCTFGEAVEHGKRWVGDDDWTPPRRRAKESTPAINKNKDYALRIWNDSTEIKGTAGEKYLHSRGLNFDKWPAAVRWSQQHGCLVFCSTATTGETSAIQRVYINSDGTPRLDDNGLKVKRSLGPQQGGAVRFSVSQSDKSGVICLAEGPETGLSVHFGTTLDTWVTLGSMAHVDLSPVGLDTVIVICRDDDPRNAPSRKVLADSIRRWRKDGLLSRHCPS